MALIAQLPKARTVTIIYWALLLLAYAGNAVLSFVWLLPRGGAIYVQALIVGLPVVALLILPSWGRRTLIVGSALPLVLLPFRLLSDAAVTPGHVWTERLTYVGLVGVLVAGCTLYKGVRQHLLELTASESQRPAE